MADANTIPKIAIIIQNVTNEEEGCIFKRMNTLTNPTVPSFSKIAARRIDATVGAST